MGSLEDMDLGLGATASFSVDEFAAKGPPGRGGTGGLGGLGMDQTVDLGPDPLGVSDADFEKSFELPKPVTAGKSGGYFWNLSYYQPYFEVCTTDVQARVAAPFKRGTTFLQDLEQPDMYGPLWIGITLSLLLVFVANTAMHVNTYFDVSGEAKVIGTEVHKLSASTTLVSMAFMAYPAALAFALRGTSGSVPVLSLVTLVGYGFSPLLVSTLLLLVPASPIHVLGLLLGCGLSARFVLRNLGAEIEQLPSDRRSLVYGATAFVYATWAYVVEYYMLVQTGPL